MVALWDLGRWVFGQKKDESWEWEKEVVVVTG